MWRVTWTNHLPKLEYPRPTFARVLAVLRTVRQTYATLNLRPCLSSILTNQGTGYLPPVLGKVRYFSTGCTEMLLLNAEMGLSIKNLTLDEKFYMFERSEFIKFPRVSAFYRPRRRVFCYFLSAQKVKRKSLRCFFFLVNLRYKER